MARRRGGKATGGVGAIVTAVVLGVWLLNGGVASLVDSVEECGSIQAGENCSNAITTPGAANGGDAATRPGATGPGAVAPPETVSAAAVLESLPVKGRAPKTGYDRDKFGPAWTDDNDSSNGHNGCDERNDALRAAMPDETIKPGTNGCVVLTGTLNDPYTGTTIHFVRGVSTSSAVQLDHVVALSNSWQTGAQQLTAAQRQNLATDPLNLQPTDGPTNSQKSDGDAATWLPPNKEYRCTYVARQVAVKQKYSLWVTQPEHDAIEGILATCPEEPIPA